MTYDDYDKTEWFPRRALPQHDGAYEVVIESHTTAGSHSGVIHEARFLNGGWPTYLDGLYFQWRGLKQDPNALRKAFYWVNRELDSYEASCDDPHSHMLLALCLAVDALEKEIDRG